MLPRAVEPPIQTISSHRLRRALEQLRRRWSAARWRPRSPGRDRPSARPPRAGRAPSRAPGSSAPSRPLWPWTSSAVMRSPRRGPAAPAATGTSVTPARVSTRRALSVTFSSSALPPTVVTARSSMASGRPAASRMATASSWPGSQSSRTGRGVGIARSLDRGHTRGASSEVMTNAHDEKRSDDAPAQERSRPAALRRPRRGRGGQAQPRAADLPRRGRAPEHRRSQDLPQPRWRASSSRCRYPRWLKPRKSKQRF